MKISEAIKELSKLQEEVGDQDLLVIADSDSPEDALVQDEFRITISKLVDDDGNTGDPVPTILIPSYDKDVCLTEDKGLKRDVDKKVMRLIEEAENLILNELHGYGARARMHLLSARDVLIQRRYFAEPAIENQSASTANGSSITSPERTESEERALIEKVKEAVKKDLLNAIVRLDSRLEEIAKSAVNEAMTEF